MSDANVALVRGIYEAFGKGDVPAVLGAMSREIEWSEAENFIYAARSPYRGHDAVVAGVFARLATEWDGFAAVPDSFVDGGDTIIVFGRYGGTYKATGRSLDAWMAHVWRIEDGRAVAFRQLVDTLAAARATGTA
jgi:ketosteroid isomerase-like protein